MTPAIRRTAFAPRRGPGVSGARAALLVAQRQATVTAAFRLELSRVLVAAHVRNGRTLLRRHARRPAARLIDELAQLAWVAERAGSLAELGRAHAVAARVYAASFPRLLKSSRLSVELSVDPERRAVGSALPVLLAFVDDLLVQEVTRGLVRAGLDPRLGLYHGAASEDVGLARDLSLELGPLLSDSVVLSAVNRRVVADHDFEGAPAACALTRAGREKVRALFERRLQLEVLHPLARRPLSYRGVVQRQAEQLARVLLGEVDAYRAFRTR